MQDQRDRCALFLALMIATLEATFGAGAGCRSLVAIIVGTGMGAGAWVDGRVIRGAIGVAGAVGHDRWPVSSAVVGALSEPAESVASGPGILALARRLDPGTGYADAPAVFRAARVGDPAARDCAVSFKKGGRTVAVATIGRDRACLQAEVALESGS